MENPECNFYRYDAISYASMDAESEFYAPVSPDIKVVLTTYSLWKETPQGYWIGYGGFSGTGLRSTGRWVSKTSIKKFAYKTKSEALNGFIKRSERRIKILESQLSSCKSALAIANGMTASP